MTTAKRKRGFRLTEGDVEIIKHIYTHRLVTIDHLMALTGRSRVRVNVRLVRLHENGYVSRRRDSPYQKYVYTLDRKAASVLVTHGVDPKETVDLRIRLQNLTDLFLQHRMMLTDLHVCLEVACRGSDRRLIDWREGKELYDKVTLKSGGKEVKLPVRPDAFFALKDTRRPEGENTSYFFLEADRSTTTHRRFQKKIVAYREYFRQGRHTQKYDIKKSARVITVTITEPRALNLCKAAGETLPGEEKRFYYFAPIKHFSLDRPDLAFGDIFISPQHPQTRRYYLIPPIERRNPAS